MKTDRWRRMATVLAATCLALTLTACTGRPTDGDGRGTAPGQGSPGVGQGETSGQSGADLGGQAGGAEAGAGGAEAGAGGAEAGAGGAGTGAGVAQGAVGDTARVGITAIAPPADALTQNPDFAVVPVPRSELPRFLLGWLEFQRVGREPTYTTAPRPDGTQYLVVAGAIQPTTGWRVAVGNARRQGEAWVLDAQLVPPPPGAPVTAQPTVPFGYYRLPAFNGPVGLEWVDPPAAQVPVPPIDRARATAVATMQWRGGSLRVTGAANVPALRLEIHGGGATLAAVDVPVKTGRYEADFKWDAAWNADGAELVLLAREGDEFWEIRRAPLDASRPPGQFWNGGSFRIDFTGGQWADRPEELIIQGQARVWEGNFIIEVRSGDEVLLRQSVHATAGAPEWGNVNTTLQVPGGLSYGEVWFIVPSAQDGSETVALVTPITVPK
jgi:hypothetical protein